MNKTSSIRNLVLVLGDQLDHSSVLFENFDPERDRIWMAENYTEATHVWCHKIRLVLFFSAMRHFRDEQKATGKHVSYHELTADAKNDSGKDFQEILKADLNEIKPETIRVVKPGDLRVEKLLSSAAEAANTPITFLEDTHFYVTEDRFSEHAKGRKTLIMEHFYREQRRRFEILVDEKGNPEGGFWNYDDQNREKFGKKGPENLPSPPDFKADSLTRAVIQMVEDRFKDHPGKLDAFDWPVTRKDALSALDDFIEHRLPNFGTYEDAMWQEEALLYHSRLSALMNLKLLNPRECVDAAVDAYRKGHAPLNSVEGFVRQILGWREFIRGVYNREMPHYADRNALQCGDRDVPTFFWDGETDMACVKDCMNSVIQTAWNHHIPRLMVLGQFSLLLGVHPYKFHEWHMAMYADAIDWVSLPNTLGMSQFGDGGIVGTKPYCASGNYINKMSNYCKGCRYNFKEAHGENACPFTTLYWDFLDRHQQAFSKNHRMGFQMKNLERKSVDELKQIRSQADGLRNKIDKGIRI